jgi:hypothetical protein
MKFLDVNLYIVLTGAVLSMVVGFIWYGPLFGKKWLAIIGADAADLAARKKMQKAAGPFYIMQFLMTLLQVFALALIVALTGASSGLDRALLIWAAFVVPTLAGAIMWTNEPGKQKKARFLIQGGYQLVMFVIFGLLIQLWK